MLISVSIIHRLITFILYTDYVRIQLPYEKCITSLKKNTPNKLLFKYEMSIYLYLYVIINVYSLQVDLSFRYDNVV